MTHTESLATKRLALLANRDALLKQSQSLRDAFTAQSESLTDLCNELTALLLSAEARLAERDAELTAQQETIHTQQMTITRCQTELNTLRREIATLRQTPVSTNAEATLVPRSRSLQRAMQKQCKDHFSHQHTLETQVADLTAQLSAKDEQLHTLRAKWEDAHLCCMQLAEINRTQEEELRHLRPATLDSAPPSTKEEPTEKIVATAPIITDPAIDELNQLARTFTISVVGGSNTWQQKAQKAFPALRFLGNQDFDDDKLATTDILLINTNHVPHSCTNKATNLATARHAEICYTNKHNLSQIAELLCTRIHDLLT